MRRVDRRMACAVGLLAATLMGCNDSGERAAHVWMQAQKPSLKLTELSPVPPVIDTPAAGYSSKTTDPFLPERVFALARSDKLAPRTDVLFSDMPITSLIVTGYLAGDQRAPIAIVHGGTLYCSVRIGDRLGQEAATVKRIGPQGVLIAREGAPDHWLPINKL